MRPPMQDAGSRGGESAALLEEAEALGIPWAAILSGEIIAEKVLKASVDDLEADWPLSCLFYLLPNSLLQSWRARERLNALSWQARGESSRKAARDLRSVFLHLSGKQTSRAPVDFLFANHLCFGYQRVLELIAITRAAERTRGNRSERAAAVVRKWGCTFDDADWAVQRAAARRKGYSLEDAMRKARQEGFELPVSTSELKAFTRLKAFVRRLPFLKTINRGRGRRSINGREVVPARIPLVHGAPGIEREPRQDRWLAHTLDAEGLLRASTREGTSHAVPRIDSTNRAPNACEGVHVPGGTSPARTRRAHATEDSAVKA